MESLLLPACVLVFFGVLALRVAAIKPDQKPATAVQRLKLARILFAALLTLGVVYFNLKKMESSLDGQPPAESGTLERIVRALAP